MNGPPLRGLLCELFRLDGWRGLGFGHCVTTYEGDGDPLPSFSGEPYLLPLAGDIEQVADTIWDALDESDEKHKIEPETIEKQIQSGEDHFRQKLKDCGKDATVKLWMDHKDDPEWYKKFSMAENPTVNPLL